MTKQDIFDQVVRFMVDELEIDEQLISEDARLKVTFKKDETCVCFIL